MAIAGSVLMPNSANFTIEKWQRSVEGATYQKMVTIPTVDEGDRPYTLLHVRKHARVASTVLAQSADGTGLTASNISATPITVTPAGNYIMVAWSANEDAQSDLNLDAESAGNIEQALAESTETGFLLNVATLTQNMSQAGVDAPMLRQAMGRLIGNTNGVVVPGGGKPMIYGVFSHTQLPNLMSIPEINNAQMRGDSETPFVTGIWTRGAGFSLLLTTVVLNDANGWHNCLYIPSAFITAWNVRSQIKRQEFELAHKVIIFNNLGTAVKHDLRAIDLRTTATAL